MNAKPVQHAACSRADHVAADTVLVVDDDLALAETLDGVLASAGYAVRTALDGDAALRILQHEDVDLVLTDLVMPGVGGDDLLAQVKPAFPHVPVVVMTSFGSVRGAVSMLKSGAAEYLPKPLVLDELLDAIRTALDGSQSQRARARAARHASVHFEGIVARSAAMKSVIAQASRVAPSTAPVLISGETGTGKELLARAIHRASGRGTFVPVNCSAIPQGLLESELFGHVRGAFTGAERDRIGLLEAAHGGTLFLDEIAELPLALQAKLLRALQSGEYRRVGDVDVKTVDVRLIAATHRDLTAAVHAGQFREDLFYRINVLRLQMPPLRDRTSDIPLLVERCLDEIAARDGGPVRRLSPGAQALLSACAWPGNVRQLRNVIERAALLGDGPILDADALPAEITGARPDSTAARRIGTDLTLADIEREHIMAVLERVGGNRTRAAAILGMPRRTLYRRLDEYLNP